MACPRESALPSLGEGQPRNAKTKEAKPTSEGVRGLARVRGPGVKGGGPGAKKGRPKEGWKARSKEGKVRGGRPEARKGMPKAEGGGLGAERGKAKRPKLSSSLIATNTVARHPRGRVRHVESPRHGVLREAARWKLSGTPRVASG